ncbi:MAG TPA: LytTR family DNA-binding domain-containing protein [Allosphingosinicella sp.]|uniref:LytTR family DNA-binding domain-containing protein n=1 Tax=Allosphingosinicella sp. TaxID=2823234 RepID=UPI002ED84E27
MDALPFLPDQIQLVRGAGNYVELEVHDRTIPHRATLKQVKLLLAPHGFVRVSRSIMVPKRRIDKLTRHGGRRVVRLSDGAEYRVGSTFSA